MTLLIDTRNDFAMRKNKNKYKIFFIGFVLAAFVMAIALYSNAPQSTQITQMSVEAMTAKTKEACSDANRQQSSSKETCYASAFNGVALQNGHEYAFNVLFALQKIDIDARGCHLMAHGIGKSAYKNNPEKWQELINTLPPVCSYGAIHGVIENYVASLRGEKSTTEILPTICGPKPRADCNHIVGHLALVETQAKIDPALDICANFANDYQREFCLTGVFMEYQTALNLIEHGYAPESWLNWPARVDELEAMCRAYDGENATACWKEIVHAALTKFRNNPEKIFDFCNSAQIEEGAKQCKRHGLGIMAAGLRFDLESLKYACKLKQPSFDPLFERDCYVNLVASELSTVLPEEAANIIPFCSSLDEQYRNSCFSQIGGTLRALGAAPEKIEALCNPAPDEYKSKCIGERTTQTTQIIRGD